MRATLDANIIIYLQARYPRDIFSSLWNLIEGEIDLGNACICEAIFEELERGGDDLSKWAKSLNGFICDTTDAELVTVQTIAVDHPDWVQEQKNAGDPFIIAHGKEESRVVITDETRKGPNTIDKNQKIPNIADEHRVECQSFFEYMRSQGWSF